MILWAHTRHCVCQLTCAFCVVATTFPALGADAFVLIDPVLACGFPAAIYALAFIDSCASTLSKHEWLVPPNRMEVREGRSVCATNYMAAVHAATQMIDSSTHAGKGYSTLFASIWAFPRIRASTCTSPGGPPALGHCMCWTYPCRVCCRRRKYIRARSHRCTC